MNYEFDGGTRLKVAWLEKKGYRYGASTLIPLAIYFKGGWAKVEMALAKGRKLYDKRQSMKKKDDRKEMDRATGKRRR